MTLLKHAIKFRSRFTLAPSKPNYAFSSSRQSVNHFSTGTEQPPPPQNPPFIGSLRNTRSGVVHARLLGVSKHTLKSDVIYMLEGCNLTPDDIKVRYDAVDIPFDMVVQFSSYDAFDTAVRSIAKRRSYRLEMDGPSTWENAMPTDGKTVLLQGFPINTVTEDIERFLDGCPYDPSSIRFSRRGTLGRDVDKVAYVRFYSRIEATNAVILKNKGFCLNGEVSMRVLE